MTGAPHIEPREIAVLVDAYVSSEFEEAHRYENREVLDESGVYGIHALAAAIYAKAFEEGVAAQFWKDNAQRSRERDAARRTPKSVDPMVAVEAATRQWCVDNHIEPPEIPDLVAVIRAALEGATQ